MPSPVPRKLQASVKIMLLVLAAWLMVTGAQDVTLVMPVKSRSGVFTLELLSGTSGPLALSQKWGTGSMRTRIWAVASSSSPATAPAKVILRGGGNLQVLSAGNVVLWSSGTAGMGTAPHRLVVRDDGNCVLYDSKNMALWSTGTFRPAPVHTSHFYLATGTLAYPITKCVNGPPAANTPTSFLLQGPCTTGLPMSKTLAVPVAGSGGFYQLRAGAKVLGQDYCWAVVAGGTAAGTKVQLAPCNSAAANQQYIFLMASNRASETFATVQRFNIRPRHTEALLTNMCVEVRQGGAGDRVLLQLAKCTYGNAQRFATWTPPPGALPSGMFMLVDGTKPYVFGQPSPLTCVAVTGEGAPGIPLYSAVCGPHNPRQRYTLVDRGDGAMWLMTAEQYCITVADEYSTDTRIDFCDIIDSQAFELRATAKRPDDAVDRFELRPHSHAAEDQCVRSGTQLGPCDGSFDTRFALVL